MLRVNGITIYDSTKYKILPTDIKLYLISNETLVFRKP